MIARAGIAPTPTGDRAGYAAQDFFDFGPGSPTLAEAQAQTSARHMHLHSHSHSTSRRDYRRQNVWNSKLEQQSESWHLFTSIEQATIVKMARFDIRQVWYSQGVPRLVQTEN